MAQCASTQQKRWPSSKMACSLKRECAKAARGAPAAAGSAPGGAGSQARAAPTSRPAPATAQWPPRPRPTRGTRAARWPHQPAPGAPPPARHHWTPSPPAARPRRELPLRRQHGLPRHARRGATLARPTSAPAWYNLRHTRGERDTGFLLRQDDRHGLHDTLQAGNNKRQCTAQRDGRGPESGPRLAVPPWCPAWLAACSGSSGCVLGASGCLLARGVLTGTCSRAPQPISASHGTATRIFKASQTSTSASNGMGAHAGSRQSQDGRGSPRVLAGQRQSLRPARATPRLPQQPCHSGPA